jgi:deoxyadenosine/deoxycytidine kinase
MLIGIAGMVGSGKSTLTRALATRFGLQHALESVDDENPWLEKFYAGGEAEMRANALPLQLHFLATRFESMRRMRGSVAVGFSIVPGTRMLRSSPGDTSKKG